MFVAEDFTSTSLACWTFREVAWSSSVTVWPRGRTVSTLNWGLFENKPTIKILFKVSIVTPKIHQLCLSLVTNSFFNKSSQGRYELFKHGFQNFIVAWANLPHLNYRARTFGTAFLALTTMLESNVACSGYVLVPLYFLAESSGRSLCRFSTRFVQKALCSWGTLLEIAM